jgi:Ca2+-binding RTX toxin-like protein
MKHPFVALVLVLGLVTWAAPSTAAAVAPTCDGTPATIVVTEDTPDARGTDGDDVVVIDGDMRYDYVFEAGDGDDKVCGGSGSDTVDAGAGADWVNAYDGHDTLLGGPGPDFLMGGAGDDQLVGDDASGASADRLFGGSDDDTLYFAPGGDEAVADRGNGGGGTDRARWSTIANPGVHIDVATATGPGVVGSGLVSIEAWVGTAFDDVIVGSPEDDVLDGDGGDDDIDGRGGDDVLSADQGVVHGGAGADSYRDSYDTRRLTVDLGPGSDAAVVSEGGGYTILGGPGRDSFSRLAPSEGVDGDKLAVEVFGGPGDDLLTFEDYVQGFETQPDWMVDLDTRTHRATAYGTVDFHSITDFRGSPIADRFRGARDRDDRFHGLAGNDVLVGLGGQDLLVGGAGRDRADGGAGRDTCRAERRTSCERR